MSKLKPNFSNFLKVFFIFLLLQIFLSCVPKTKPPKIEDIKNCLSLPKIITDSKLKSYNNSVNVYLSASKNMLGFVKSKNYIGKTRYSAFLRKLNHYLEEKYKDSVTYYKFNNDEGHLLRNNNIEEALSKETFYDSPYQSLSKVLNNINNNIEKVNFPETTIIVTDAVEFLEDRTAITFSTLIKPINKIIDKGYFFSILSLKSEYGGAYYSLLNWKFQQAHFPIINIDFDKDEFCRAKCVIERPFYLFIISSNGKFFDKLNDALKSTTYNISNIKSIQFKQKLPDINYFDFKLPRQTLNYNKKNALYVVHKDINDKAVYLKLKRDKKEKLIGNLDLELKMLSTDMNLAENKEENNSESLYNVDIKCKIFESSRNLKKTNLNKKSKNNDVQKECSEFKNLEKNNFINLKVIKVKKDDNKYNFTLELKEVDKFKEWLSCNTSIYMKSNTLESPKWVKKYSFNNDNITSGQLRAIKADLQTNENSKYKDFASLTDNKKLKYLLRTLSFYQFIEAVYQNEQLVKNPIIKFYIIIEGRLEK